MIVFKCDIIELLASKNWTVKRIRKEKRIGQKTLYEMINNNTVPGIKTINTLCELLNMQPGSFIKYIQDDNKTE